MAGSTRGRTGALLGALVAAAGLIAAITFSVMSLQRPSAAVDGFARAPAGCTTTLSFTETGTFYIYAETGGNGGVAADDCDPSAAAGRVFGFDLTGPGGEIEPRRDSSVDYAEDGIDGASVARVEITDPGNYEITVFGDDVGTMAAIGRDPSDGVSGLRMAALWSLLGGLIVGGLLIALARRRQRVSDAASPGPFDPTRPQGGPMAGQPTGGQIPGEPGWSPGPVVPPPPHTPSPEERAPWSTGPTGPTGPTPGEPTRPPWAPPAPDERLPDSD